MNPETIQPLRLWRRHPRAVSIAALALGAGGAALLGVYGTDSRWVPKCLFHTLTGLDCPGCGSQRAISSALHGHLSEAWHYNPALWIGLCVAMLYALNPCPGKPERPLQRILYSPAASITILTAIIAWTILRNL